MHVEAFQYHPGNFSSKGTSPILTRIRHITRHLFGSWKLPITSRVASPVPLVAVSWDPVVEPHLVAADDECNLRGQLSSIWYHDFTRQFPIYSQIYRVGQVV